MSAISDIVDERRRQVEIEGWTLKHDDKHDHGEMALAAGCYALSSAQGNNTMARALWPWAKRWWKPKSPRLDLVRAGALIVAEIERLDRLSRNKDPRT